MGIKVVVRELSLRYESPQYVQYGENSKAMMPGNSFFLYKYLICAYIRISTSTKWA